jgi:hypothetical protein
MLQSHVIHGPSGHRDEGYRHNGEDNRHDTVVAPEQIQQAASHAHVALLRRAERRPIAGRQ